MQAGQGRIEDRKREFLGRSDAAIILWRRILARELGAIAEGATGKAMVRCRPTDVVPNLGVLTGVYRRAIIRIIRAWSTAARAPAPGTARAGRAWPDRRRRTATPPIDRAERHVGAGDALEHEQMDAEWRRDQSGLQHDQIDDAPPHQVVAHSGDQRRDDRDGDEHHSVGIHDRAERQIDEQDDAKNTTGPRCTLLTNSVICCGSRSRPWRTRISAPR